MRIYTSGITASIGSRTLSGPVVAYGVPGRTSAGLLKVAPGALKFPDDLSRVKLTEEHHRDRARGHLVLVEESDGGIRASLKVSDGPLGDAALQEAADRTRDGFSFDVVDATVEGDTITSALVIAIGQVGIPAFDDMRIDTIAAALNTPPNPGVPMTDEQIARLAALREQQNLTPEEQGELSQLLALAADQVTGGDPEEEDAPAEDAPVAVAASVPAVPAGLPRPARTKPRGTALQQMVAQVTAGLRSAAQGGSALPSITAALSDVTSTAHTSVIEPVAWSGELWSGLEYQPVFSDLLLRDTLTNWEGKGWRFLTTPDMQDYAGDKAAIPSGTVTTEASEYEAARMAVGVDIDRKFYDFPNEGFVNGLFERIRESWEIKLDAKVRAYIAAQAVAATRSVSIATTNADATITFASGLITASDVGAAITGTGIPASTTILSVTNATTAELSQNATATGTPTATLAVQATNVLTTAARLAQTLRNTRVGRDPWIVVNDEDMFSLLNMTNDDLPAFLSLYGIDPGNFRASQDVPIGTIWGGVKQAAKLRVLPGSPIRVSAQHLANGGVDEAFFGYWAIEEHHPNGIVKATYRRA